MTGWKAHLELERPCWTGYRVAIGRLRDGPLPSADDLNALLLPGQANSAGRRLKFRPAAQLPGVDYERHIYETGEVSTREDNWHDLFNALAWSRFPRLKAALNESHYRHLHEARDGRRGAQRDALTLLDESGVIVTSPDRGLLDALRARDWQAAFVTRRASWATSGVMVCGHAILEKLLAPYKALTAHALLLPLDGAACAADLDAGLAERLRAGALAQTTGDLSPLPLMGIPGWWPAGPQDGAFYADRAVFRPPRGD
jgi:hypothetical protein